MAIASATFPETALAPREENFARKLLRHPLALLGGAIIFALLGIALYTAGADYLDPNYAYHRSPQAPLPNGLGELGQPHAPGNGFTLGADTLGRDVWTRTLHGTKISLLVAFCAMITAVLIGTTIGLIGGYFGGWVDVIITRLTEAVMSLPTVLLAIALLTVLPGESYWARLSKLLIAIALVTWTGIARAVRGQVLSLKEQEFIEASRAIGCSHARIIFVHLLPNVLPTVIVLATLATAHNILLEAGLSYLGLGMEAGVPSWGGMIAEGQPYILAAPWITLVPGCAIVLAVAGFNLLGQALQETLEPRP